MRFNTRSQPARSSRTRTALRPSSNRRLRRSARHALHRGFRQIIPACGPEFHQALVALERALKVAQSTFEQADPGWRQNRFKTACSPEEADRRAEEDLQRAYGKEAIARRHAAESMSHPLSKQPKPVPSTPTQTAVPPSSPQTPTPTPPQKPDIIRVPLPRLPENYSSSLPAPSNRLESLLFSLFGRT